MSKLASNLVRVLFCLTVALGVVSTVAASEAQSQEWQFRVYLDDAEIGYHHFLLTDSGSQRQVQSKADLRVRFLIFDAYRYEHENIEQWDGQCLEGLQSRTEVNGKPMVVEGRRQSDAFTIDTADSRRDLPGCVKSFAYWDPRFLHAPRLLNPQTGEYIDVEIHRVDEETLNVRGEPVPASRYRLRAKEMELDLWYSEDDLWLALESTVKGGRKLRYVLF